MACSPPTLSFVRKVFSPPSLPFILGLTLVVALLSFAPTSPASPLTLTWEPVTGDSRIAGYEIHIGRASGRYEWVLDADQEGAATDRLEFESAEPGITYYLAARSRNHSRTQFSAFSKEIRISLDGPPIDSGELLVDDAWQWVSFQTAFTDPIVVATTASESDSDPHVIRIAGIEPHGFWIRLQEWDYLDGRHTFDSVGYIAMERGRYQLENGAQVEAGRLVTTATNRQIQAGFSQTFASAPVVMAAVTSDQGTEAVTTEIQSVGRSGFSVGMIEQEASDQQHVAERIDFIAWEVSTGTIKHMQYAVGRTAAEVTHRPYEIRFNTAFRDAPLLLAHLQTTNGGDPATVRWQTKNDKLASLRVVEEQSLDAETGHIPETAGYILIGP
ncbi:hypothetical protein SAMN05421783_11254 [Thiocapsa roseopersicina]|uniref:Fibronectin type-III domain-containing protein n=2 Tax=Thiocapsa roseopersicina TaxID=1058 RepID=A0A1H2Y5D8_THIRO|nr:hypothetical protein SAMN05421783_11254 [Thiocapsa roseopersicina]